MTTLCERNGKAKAMRPSVLRVERRSSRRHDLELQSLHVKRCAARKTDGAVLGQLVDLSSGGMRVRTTEANVKPDQQIRVRLELPAYAGISPFVDTSGHGLRGKSEWVGWMAVTRVENRGSGQFDVAGRLVDMEQIDRGMLGLYLSMQPLAA